MIICTQTDQKVKIVQRGPPVQFPIPPGLWSIFSFCILFCFNKNVSLQHSWTWTLGRLCLLVVMVGASAQRIWVFYLFIFLGQLRPVLVRRPGRTLHTEPSFFTSEQTDLCSSEEPPQRNASLHQTERRSGQRGDGGRVWNDKHLDNGF